MSLPLYKCTTIYLYIKMLIHLLVTWGVTTDVFYEQGYMYNGGHVNELAIIIWSSKAGS